MFSRICNLFFAFLITGILSACMSSNSTEPAQVSRQLASEAPRILTMGDSLLAGHSDIGVSIADRLAVHLGEQIADRSLATARMDQRSGGSAIPSQYVTGDWDIIVLNGGGNDITTNCLCAACNNSIDHLIGPDGQSGEIASLVTFQLATGADVIYVGYLRNPNVMAALDGCSSAALELERRIEQMALNTDGFHYLEVNDRDIPNAAPKIESLNSIYLSAIGANEVARRLASLIRGIRVQRAGLSLSQG